MERLETKETKDWRKALRTKLKSFFVGAWKCLRWVITLPKRGWQNEKFVTFRGRQTERMKANKQTYVFVFILVLILAFAFRPLVKKLLPSEEMKVASKKVEQVVTQEKTPVEVVETPAVEKVEPLPKPEQVAPPAEKAFPQKMVILLIGLPIGCLIALRIGTSINESLRRRKLERAEQKRKEAQARKEAGEAGEKVLPEKGKVPWDKIRKFVVIVCIASILIGLAWLFKYSLRRYFYIMTGFCFGFFLIDRYWRRFIPSRRFVRDLIIKVLIPLAAMIWYMGSKIGYKEFFLNFTDGWPIIFPWVATVIFLFLYFLAAWGIMYRYGLEEKGILMKILWISIPLIALHLILEFKFLPTFDASGTTQMPVSFTVYKAPPGFKLPEERFLCYPRSRVPLGNRAGELLVDVTVESGMCFAVYVEGSVKNSLLGDHLERRGRERFEEITEDPKTWVRVNELPIDRGAFPCPTGGYSWVCLSIGTRSGGVYQYIPIEPGRIIYLEAHFEGVLRGKFNLPDEPYYMEFVEPDIRLSVWRVSKDDLPFILNHEPALSKVASR